MDKLLLPAKTASLDAFFELVLRKVEYLGLTEEMTFNIKLVLEEVLTNIIFYAYPDGEGEMEVKCSIENDEKLCLTMVDRGVPFNPLDHAPPDLSSDLSDRNIGGMGIHLFRQLADEVHYRREEDKNMLRVCFNI